MLFHSIYNFYNYILHYYQISLKSRSSVLYPEDHDLNPHCNENLQSLTRSVFWSYFPHQNLNNE